MNPCIAMMIYSFIYEWYIVIVVEKYKFSIPNSKTRTIWICNMARKLYEFSAHYSLLAQGKRDAPNLSHGTLLVNWKNDKC
jgi:hypothetical protein